MAFETPPVKASQRSLPVWIRPPRLGLGGMKRPGVGGGATGLAMTGGFGVPSGPGGALTVGSIGSGLAPKTRKFWSRREKKGERTGGAIACWAATSSGWAAMSNSSARLRGFGKPGASSGWVSGDAMVRCAKVGAGGLSLGASATEASGC